MTKLNRIINLLEQYDRLAATAMNPVLGPFVAPYQLTALREEKNNLVQELKESQTTYRYYLFYYDDYYPSGGMEDCVHKTNDFAELEQIIILDYDGKPDWATIAYYDAVDDKYFVADMRWHKGKDYFDVLRFHGWEEVNNEDLG